MPVRAATVVVAADAWTNELLASVGRPSYRSTVLQEQVSYYDVADPGPFALGHLPVWIWMDEPSFYGFPVFGRAGVKIAQDCGGQAVTGDTRRFAADPAILSRTDDFARTFFGGRLGPAAHTATCLYTLTPDRDFVLDPCPGQPRVLVALGAAHGYKFAAWFGRTLAALAAGRQPEDDLALFAVDRPALAAPDRCDELAGLRTGPGHGSSLPPDDRRPRGSAGPRPPRSAWASTTRSSPAIPRWPTRRRSAPPTATPRRIRPTPSSSSARATHPGTSPASCWPPPASTSTGRCASGSA